MKTRISAAVVAAALWLVTPGAEGQYVVRSGVTTSSYSYGYYPSLGTSFANYTNGYYAGPGVPPGSGGSGTSSSYGTSGMVYPTTINSAAPGGRITVASVNGTYIPPYSYTAVGHPYYARHYSGYGNNDYPFYGRIYGSPNDPWSWTYLGGGYANALARYYYPPVR